MKEERIGTRGSVEIVSQLLSKDLLPQYQQAANEGGYRLDVVAEEGDKWFYDAQAFGNRGNVIAGETTRTSQVIKEGYVAIDIKKPTGEKDHGSFWRKVEELKEKTTS